MNAGRNVRPVRGTTRGGRIRRIVDGVGDDAVRRADEDEGVGGGDARRGVRPAANGPGGHADRCGVETIGRRGAARARRRRAGRPLTYARRADLEAADACIAALPDAAGVRRGAVGVMNAWRVYPRRQASAGAEASSATTTAVSGVEESREEAAPVGASRVDLGGVQPERAAVDDRRAGKAGAGHDASGPDSQKAPLRSAPPSVGTTLTAGSPRGFGEGQRTSDGPPRRRTRRRRPVPRPSRSASPRRGRKRPASARR